MYKLFHIPESTFVPFNQNGLWSKTRWKVWLRSHRLYYDTRRKAYGWIDNNSVKFYKQTYEWVIVLDNREFEIVEMKNE
jgi:hypothetical protein